MAGSGIIGRNNTTIQNITKKSTYMRKKNTAQDIEDMKQIIREFPGTIARKVSASGFELQQR